MAVNSFPSTNHNAGIQARAQVIMEQGEALQPPGSAALQPIPVTNGQGAILPGAGHRHIVNQSEVVPVQNKVRNNLDCMHFFKGQYGSQIPDGVGLPPLTTADSQRPTQEHRPPTGVQTPTTTAGREPTTPSVQRVGQLSSANVPSEVISTAEMGMILKFYKCRLETSLQYSLAKWLRGRRLFVSGGMPSLSP